MKIDENIKNQTTHCTRDFECLKGENYRLLNGNVKRIVEGTVFVVKCNELICHYKMTFGTYVICNCPVRKEIFRRKNEVKHSSPLTINAK